MQLNRIDILYNKSIYLLCINEIVFLIVLFIRFYLDEKNHTNKLSTI